MRFCFVAVFAIFLSVDVIADRGVNIVPKEVREENRVALVIGNKDYTSLNSLRNPINDARDMANILTKKGFDVISLENASQWEMEQAIKKFSNKIKNGGVGLFYYAGHGVEVNGVNYLIPSDAQIPSLDFVKSKTVSVDSVLSAMENSNNRFNILILDACRSNPFGRGGGGLAPINNATGIFVAYATAPGKIAEDGAESNGLFTKYLKKYMNENGLKIEEVFKSVGRDVQKESNTRQTPWTSSSVYGDFYFSLPSAKIAKLKNSTTSIKKNIFTIDGVMYQKYPSSAIHTWQEAKDYCQGLTLGRYNDWRLSSFKELIKTTTLTPELFKNLSKEREELPELLSFQERDSNPLKYQKNQQSRDAFFKKIEKYKQPNGLFIQDQFIPNICTNQNVTPCVYWSSDEKSSLLFSNDAYIMEFYRLRKGFSKKSYKKIIRTLCVR